MIETYMKLSDYKNNSGTNTTFSQANALWNKIREIIKALPASFEE
jgi:hypothetical protein